MFDTYRYARCALLVPKRRSLRNDFHIFEPSVLNDFTNRSRYFIFTVTENQRERELRGEAKGSTRECGPNVGHFHRVRKSLQSSEDRFLDFPKHDGGRRLLDNSRNDFCVTDMRKLTDTLIIIAGEVNKLINLSTYRTVEINFFLDRRQRSAKRRKAPE